MQKGPRSAIMSYLNVFILLPRQVPVQRITVPACSRCNRGYSDDEAHFRNVMLLAGDANEAVQELWPKAVSSFRQVDGRKRVWDIRRLAETVQVDGTERWVIYPARDERILRVV